MSFVGPYNVILDLYVNLSDLYRLGTYSRVYTLFKDIYAAHFPKLFDIYKCLRIETIFIQYIEKIPRILLWNATFSLSDFITRLKIKSTEDFATDLKISRLKTLKNCAKFSDWLLFSFMWIFRKKKIICHWMKISWIILFNRF